MTLSRKDFFKQGFFSLGETLLKMSGTMAKEQQIAAPAADTEQQDREPTPDIQKVATPDNRNCLAKNCGCFSCVDRCEADAIMLIPGTGISINKELCNGCGTCEYICPVTPKAITLQTRHPE